MEAGKGGNNFNTPGMWPAASAYPAGQPLKSPTTDCWYNRESTLGETEATRPRSALPDRLRRTLEREKGELIQLRNVVNMERLELVKPRPGTAPAAGRTRKKSARNQAAKALTNKSNKSKTTYWGEMSATVKKELLPSAALASLSKQNRTQKLQSDQKWALLRDFYKCYRRSSRGGPQNPGLQDLHELAELFVASCEEVSSLRGGFPVFLRLFSIPLLFSSLLFTPRSHL